MKKYLFFFLVLISCTTAYSQNPGFLKSRTMQVNGETVYIVSLADLGFPKNILAVQYGQIVSHAAAKGYKLCSEDMAQNIYATYSDKTRSIDAFHWLTICTPEGNTYTVGQGSDGKFIQNAEKKTWHVFLNYTHSCLVFTK